MRIEYDNNMGAPATSPHRTLSNDLRASHLINTNTKKMVSVIYPRYSHMQSRNAKLTAVLISLVLVVVGAGCTSSPKVVVTHSIADDSLVVSDLRVDSNKETSTTGNNNTVRVVDVVNRTIRGTVQNSGNREIQFLEIRLTPVNSTTGERGASRTFGFNNLSQGEKQPFQASFLFVVKGNTDLVGDGGEMYDSNLIEVGKPFY